MIRVSYQSVDGVYISKNCQTVDAASAFVRKYAGFDAACLGQRAICADGVGVVCIEEGDYSTANLLHWNDVRVSVAPEFPMGEFAPEGNPSEW